MTLRLPLAELPSPLPIPTIDRPFDVAIRPPGSKSITNRALLLAGLAAGESCLRRPLLDADDTERMVAALTALGVRFDLLGGGQSDALLVEGVGGRWEQPAPGESLILNLNNAGTATRFLAAAAALADPESRGITIDGNARMRKRPIGELVALLRQIGLRVDELAEPGCVPIHVWPPTAAAALNHEIAITPTLSSQFISALMLVAPFLPSGLLLHIDGALTSQSYIEMTLGLLRTVGVKAAAEMPDGHVVELTPNLPEEGHNGHGAGRGWIRIFPAEFDFGVAASAAGQEAAPPDAPPRTAQCILEPFELEIEPDASSATYFWAAAALVPGARCRVPGIDAASLQGDSRFVHLLAEMGAAVSVDEDGDGATTVAHARSPLRPIKADLSRMPDAAMTLAALCCFADGRSELRGLRTLRVKETDRIAALQTELARIGVQVDPITGGGDEGLAITPPSAGVDRSSDAAPVVFETYDDHRMAMSLALIGLLRPNVSINDPACVAKTYPGFWSDLATLYE